MNERIKLLAVQAGEEAVKSVPFFRTGRCQIPSWVNVFIEVRDKKFAELIVRECMTQIQQVREIKAGHAGPEYTQGFDDGMFVAISTIEEHFGVE